MIANENAAPAAQTFRLRTALLQKGRTHRILASTRSPERAMNIAIKCYAEGGENEFHTHGVEDHTFVVLQGRATFHQPDRPSQELGRNEGILIPAGAYYKFEAVPGEPLVLLRVGNAYQPVEGSTRADNSVRIGTDGLPLPGHSQANKHVDGVPIEGAFYE
jgi:mannose-6-phosphate isomerase-like protein (cupin superfamily)